MKRTYRKGSRKRRYNRKHQDFFVVLKRFLDFIAE